MARTTSTPEEVLNLAMSKERAAFRAYDRMLRVANIDLIRDLLQDLKNEEYKHIQMIEARLMRIRLG